MRVIYIYIYKLAQTSQPLPKRKTDSSVLLKAQASRAEHKTLGLHSQEILTPIVSVFSSLFFFFF
jgi:hypothetical protein